MCKSQASAYHLRRKLCRNAIFPPAVHLHDQQKIGGFARQGLLTVRGHCSGVTEYHCAVGTVSWLMRIESDRSGVAPCHLESSYDSSAIGSVTIKSAKKSHTALNLTYWLKQWGVEYGSCELTSASYWRNRPMVEIQKNIIKFDLWI